jgi:ATP-dependent Clp protease ATP-binding subunit ClpA
MMLERFTGSARFIVGQAQANARRLGHGYIGCEHLLMAAAMVDDPVGAVLRDHGVTPERIEAAVLRAIEPASPRPYPVHATRQENPGDRAKAPAKITGTR